LRKSVSLVIPALESAGANLESIKDTEAEESEEAPVEREKNETVVTIKRRRWWWW
jgi:hypothetical protein